MTVINSSDYRHTNMVGLRRERPQTSQTQAAGSSKKSKYATTTPSQRSAVAQAGRRRSARLELRDNLNSSIESANNSDSDVDLGNGDVDGEDDDEEEEDGSDDSEDEEEIEIDREWQGKLDEDGLPHGRGTLIIYLGNPNKPIDTPIKRRRTQLNTPQNAVRDSELDGESNHRNIFEGYFIHGSMNGRGKWTFSDGSILSGRWRADGLNGYGVYSYPDGYSIAGMYTEDELNGMVEEQSHGNLIFKGEYRNNRRNGYGILTPTDGGEYSGNWKDGVFDGPNNCYQYPAGARDRLYLKGKWKSGKLVAARLYRNDNNVPEHDIIYKSDESTFNTIANDPHLRDPYENECCYVKQSTEGEDAGEGLFARIDLPAMCVVSWYNGIKQADAVTERKPWRDNSNTIALDEEKGVDIDVPPEFSTLPTYAASLGHKANHSFDTQKRNAKYDHAQHPRFDHIKCIRTLRPVKKDEELLVDYGYVKHPNSGPDWWKRKRKLQSEENGS